MSGTRRMMLRGLCGGGLLLAAAPALAMEADAPPPEGWAGVRLAIVGGEGRITQLDPLGPAARAGLRTGDVVIAGNGGGLETLSAALAGAPGEQVALEVRRGQGRRTVRLVLEQQDSARP
ncbi:MAG: PDZ domain-containing protein [Caulobacter sp.]|nr:PDZ domain-containing protein [Caulobacter sp.]